jgi:collagenase-like PrtC family protease
MEKEENISQMNGESTQKPPLEFSIPYNGDPETLEEVFKIKKIGDNRIVEVFLSGPQQYSGASRIKEKITLEHFLEVVDRIHQEGIRANLIMNSTCEGSVWYSPDAIQTQMEYLRIVHEEHGVESVTIANPVYIREVRKRFPDIEICASVVSDIDCVSRAITFKEAGADVMTPDASINRNLEVLKQIKEATGMKLKMMVNEGCLYKCPFRKFHFNYIAHRSKEACENTGYSYDFLTHCCVPETVKDHSLILKSPWTRPEDIRKYSEITHYFKIVGRETPKDRTIRAIRAYMEESWNGDLLDILCDNLLTFSLRYSAFLDNKKLDKFNFFQKVTSCDQNCSKCHYCENVINSVLMLGWLTKEKLRDQGREEEARFLEMKELEMKNRGYTAGKNMFIKDGKESTSAM